MGVALIGDPELVFLDEPTTGFDPAARREAWSMIEGLKALGKTVFLTTHYMDEAQHLADRVAILRAGKIVALGRPDELGAGLQRGDDRDLPRGRSVRISRRCAPGSTRTAEVVGDVVDDPHGRPAGDARRGCSRGPTSGGVGWSTSRCGVPTSKTSSSSWWATMSRATIRGTRA